MITALQQQTMIKYAQTASTKLIDSLRLSLSPFPSSASSSLFYFSTFFSSPCFLHFLLLFLLISLLCVAVGIIRSMAKFALVMQATLSSPRFPPFLFLLLFLLFFFHFLYLDTFLLLLLLLFLLMPILLLHRYLPHILPPLLQTSPCLIDRIHFSARMTKMATVGEMHATWIEISK